MNVQKTIKIIILFFSFSSCTDIIELDLKNTKPKIVIEAVLNVSDSSFRTDITMSNGFYETGNFKRVSGATVNLQKFGDTPYTIPETESGVYFLDNIIAEAGDVFSVVVKDADGVVYEASTKTPSGAKIALVLPAPFSPHGETNTQDTTQYLQITTVWKDPLDIDNYYRIKTYINNRFNSKDYILVDDRIGDGDTIGAVTVHEIYSGDLFKVELLSTDKKYFNYFMDLAIIQGQGPGSTAPYNPKGNFNNEALGYFGIYTVSEFSFTFP